MTQTKLRLGKNRSENRYVPEFAEAVGLSCDAEVVTLRFIGDAQWGNEARQVRLDRKLAEQLSRLLNDELDDEAVSFRD